MADLNVTYAITVCNELKELTVLLNFLQPKIRQNDQILIQYDEGNTPKEVLDYLTILKTLHTNYKVVGYPLNNDFASFKNNLKHHADGIFILQIDADEIPNEFLVENMHELIMANLDVDLFFIPRVNVVDGITKAHVDKWGWRITKMDEYISEKVFDKYSNEYLYLSELGHIIGETDDITKYYLPINNWPDAQTRLYRRTSEIEWDGKVHERIKGYNTLTILPLEVQYSLYHYKDIKRQEEQNEFYSRL